MGSMKLWLLVVFLAVANTLLAGCRNEIAAPTAGEPVNLGKPMRLTPSDPVTMVTPTPK